MFRRRALALLTALLGCGGPALSGSSNGLTDAEDDRGHPAVGLYHFSLDGVNQTTACTATLIGAKTLITAAHCAGYTMNELEIGRPPRRYPVERDVAHPDFDPGQAWENDLALIVLVDPLPITPVPIERRRVVAREPVVLVGYGETSLGAVDNGRKRVTSNRVASLEALYFTTEASGSGRGNGCRGDSGGPVLTSTLASTVPTVQTLLGVMSFVPNLSNRCGDSTWNTRLDLFADWITDESGGDVVFADHLAPSVAITPSDGATVHAPVDVRIEANDDQAVVALEVLLDGRALTATNPALFTATLPLELGAHRLSARVRDAAGNAASAEVSVTVVADDQATDDGAAEESGCAVVGRNPGLESLGLLLLAFCAANRRRR